jgi:hypothetical protein
MELPFADIEQLFKKNEARLGDLGLQGFARLANTATGTQDYSQADVGWLGRNVKQASTAYDRWIDENMGGVKNAAGGVGEGLFGFFGQDRAVGREAGEQAVRGTLDYVPLIAGSLLAPLTGGASFLPGAAMSGALGAASAYEKTDSPLQTIMAGALPFVGGKIGEVGARMAISGASKVPGLGALGFKGGTKVLTEATEHVGAMEHLIAKTFADRFAGAVGSETMLNAATMVADSGIGLVEDGEFRNPFTMENFLANAIDPTLVFSIGEFIQPSVVATRAVKTEAQKGRVLNADLQTSAEELRQKATSPVGKSYEEVETAYLDLERDIKKKIVDTKDKDEKEFLSGELVKLDKLRQKFREDFEKPDANPGAFSPRNVFHKTFEEAQAEYTLRKAGGETPPPLDELAPEDLVNEVNAQRAEVDEPPITNEVMQSEVEAHLEEGDTLEAAVEKATEVVKSKTPSFSRQIETRISQMTEDKITDVDQARKMLIEEYKVTDEKQLTTIENRLKRLGKAKRVPLTPEQKEAAAKAGTDAPNTGRPQTKTEDQDALDWLDAQSKSADPNVQEEVKIFTRVRGASKSDVERPGVNTDLINTYKEWQRLRDAGELTYGKGKADNLTKQQVVLERMLNDMQKKRAKVPTGMPMKQSVGSSINQSFENKELAQGYADRMNLKDDGFNYKPAVRKGKHVVEATPKSTSDYDQAGTDLPPEFVVDLELLEKVRAALSQAKPEQTDSKGEPDVKVEKAVEISEDVEVPVGKPEAMGLEEKYKAGLDKVEDLSDDFDLGDLEEARALLESSKAEDRAKGVKMAVELMDAHGIRFAEFPGTNKDVEYLELAKRPEKNIDELSKLLLEKAEEKGYSVRGFHGSPNKGFTRFKLGRSNEHDWSLSRGTAIHFGNRREMSEGYNTKGEQGYGDAVEGEIRQFFLPDNLLKVAVTKDSAWFELPDGTRLNESPRNYNIKDGIYPDIEIITHETRAYVESLGFDGLRAAWGNSEEYAVFDPKKIKLADVVTYDDFGNIIPLSMRFNDLTDDMRMYAESYDLHPSHGNAITPKALIEQVLRRNGVSPDMIVASHPMFQKLFTFFDLNDVTFRELMSDSVRGKATIAGPVRELLLSGKQLGDLTDAEKLRAVEYVAGHEIGHLVEQMANSGKLLPSQQKAWTQFDQWSRTATPEELIEAQDLAMETLLPKEYQDNPVMKESLKAINSPEEFRANLISMFALGQINSPDQMGLDLLPRPVSRALHVLSEVGRVVYNAMRSVLRALPEWRPNNSARAHVYNMSQMLLSMKQQLNDTKAFYEEGRKIINVGPDAFNYRNYGGESIAPPEDTARSRLFDFAQDFVMHFDQLTQKNRHFKELGRTVHASITEQKSMLKQVVGAITGEVDASGNPQFASHNSKLAWERVVSSPLVNKTLGDWLRLQNITKPPGTNKPGMSIKLDDLKTVSPELYQRVQKLSKGDRDAVVLMRDRFENGHRVFAEMFMNHSKSVGETFVQSYLGAKMPDKWKEAPAMSHLLLEAVRTIGAVDPAQRAMGQELLAKVASQMDAQVFYKAFDLAKMAVTREAEIQATMAMAQGFSSEVRTGKHFLRWLEPDGKRHGGQGFETIKALKAYEQKLVARGATPIQVTTVERGKPQMTEPEWMQAVAEIEEKNKAYLDALDLPDDVKKQMVGLLDIQGEFQAAFGKNKAAMPTKGRKFAAGRDDLDMVASQIAYFSAGTKMIHGQIMRNRLAYQFGNPEFKDPALVKDVSRLKNMLENFAVPDTEMGTNIAAFNASYMLGMNLSTGMVEVAQPMFSFVPELMNNGMSYLKSMKLIGKAQKEVTKFTLRHIPAKIGHKLDEAMPVNLRQGRDDNELWENPEYAQFMKWAASRNAISLTHMTDIVNDAETSGLVLGEISHTGKSKRSLGQRLLSPVQQYGRLSLKFYQNFTEFNARVGLIAGYELAKSQGHTGLKAYELAEEFARTVTFSGGKVNRPKNFSGRDPFYRTVGQAMYSLQGYTTGMLSMMARYYAVGTAKNDMPGVTAQDKKNARRALRTLLATQMFGAGAIGLPFAAAAIKMIEGITGLEFEREMREGLAGLMEQDEEEDGGLLADVFLHGGMNALSDRILPGSPDFGSRLAMGGIMGVNSYDGFSLSALAGPTGSVVENVVKGVTNLAQGDSAQAFEDIAPVAWKKVINMIRNDGEFTDASGNMLTEGTSAEKFAYSVGFTPQRIAKLKHYSRLQRRSEELSLNREKRWHDQVTDLYFDNPGAAMALLQSRSASDPYFDYNGAVEKIAERVERRSLPKDPRSEGSYRGTQGNETLIRDLVGKTQPRETDRVILRENVKQTLGGGYAPQNPVTQRQLTRAQLMDQVMERMPYMPRASAAKMVDELLSR